MESLEGSSGAISSAAFVKSCGGQGQLRGAAGSGHKAALELGEPIHAEEWQSRACATALLAAAGSLPGAAV